jgi:hypothetical protein
MLHAESKEENTFSALFALPRVLLICSFCPFAMLLPLIAPAHLNQR